MDYNLWSETIITYSVQISDNKEQLQKIRNAVLVLSQVLFLLLVFNNFPDFSDHDVDHIWKVIVWGPV